MKELMPNGPIKLIVGLIVFIAYFFIAANIVAKTWAFEKIRFVIVVIIGVIGFFLFYAYYKTLQKI